MRRLLTGRGLDPLAERVLFALVCNRALASIFHVDSDKALKSYSAPR